MSTITKPWESLLPFFVSTKKNPFLIASYMQKILAGSFNRSVSWKIITSRKIHRKMAQTRDKNNYNTRKRMCVQRGYCKTGEWLTKIYMSIPARHFLLLYISLIYDFSVCSLNEYPMIAINCIPKAIDFLVLCVAIIKMERNDFDKIEKK